MRLLRNSRNWCPEAKFLPSSCVSRGTARDPEREKGNICHITILHLKHRTPAQPLETVTSSSADAKNLSLAPHLHSARRVSRPRRPPATCICHRNRPQHSFRRSRLSTRKRCKAGGTAIFSGAERNLSARSRSGGNSRLADDEIIVAGRFFNRRDMFTEFSFTHAGNMDEIFYTLLFNSTFLAFVKLEFLIDFFSFPFLLTFSCTEIPVQFPTTI